MTKNWDDFRDSGVDPVRKRVQSEEVLAFECDVSQKLDVIITDGHNNDFSAGALTEHSAFFPFTRTPVSSAEHTRTHTHTLPNFTQ